MGRKILLYLNSTNCQAYTWKNGALSAAECFDNTIQGHEQFGLFLQFHRTPVYLLTDLIEEDFRHEAVPHLHGSERNELIHRKLEQYYRNTPFCQAHTLKHLKEGRHDDDMLFSALTNPALLSPWLDLMLARNTPLAGIYSIPMISLPLVQEFSADCLLLSWEKYAGLRQTFFEAKQLRFSRLTPVNDPGAFGATARVEVPRTRQYLTNLSLLPPGQVLNVIVMCHADDKRQLEAQLCDDTDVHYSYLDIQQFGLRIGAKSGYSDSNATELFLHLLASQPPRCNYASAEHTHFFRLLQIRQSLFVLSAVFITVSLLWTAFNIKESIALKNESRVIMSQANQFLRQSLQISQSVPGTPASATDMKTAVILSRKLNGTLLPPQVLLTDLAQVLNDFPIIRIDKLSWQSSPEKTCIQPSSMPPINAAANDATQIIFFSGELTEFTGDYRSALDYLERFRASLIRHGYSVTAIALPLDVSMQGSIVSDTLNGSDKLAQFSMKIFRLPAT
jgi:hypothetical protein